MPKEPTIKSDELPKADEELQEGELEQVSGGLTGVKKHIGNVKWGNLTVGIAPDPDEGGEAR